MATQKKTPVKKAVAKKAVAKKVGRKVVPPAGKKAEAKKVEKKAVATKTTPKKSGEKKSRKEKLAVVARSLRGINRNLRLEGVADTEVRPVKDKDGAKTLQVFKGKAKTGVVLKANGKNIKVPKELTYGDWVNTVKASIK